MRTRINPGKFNELNEYGIFHLSTLLLCISNLKPEETTSQEIARDLLKVSLQNTSFDDIKVIKHKNVYHNIKLYF